MWMTFDAVDVGDAEGLGQRKCTHALPEETTILNFRRLLETHGLAQKIFEQVNQHLARKGQSLRAGTIVGATIVAAPSSTKNKDGKRELSPAWPVINRKKPALPDAEKWDGVPDKLKLLIREATE